MTNGVVIMIHDLGKTPFVLMKFDKVAVCGSGG
jgi:4-hydroxy-L-threonine phosphate dehydrogenase PdxA